MGLWRNRDFAILWSGRAVSEFGSAMSIVTLPLLTLSVGGSPTHAGLVLATSTVASLIVALYAGAVVDRVNRKKAMLASVLVRALAFGVVAVTTATGRTNLTELYAVAAVLGVAGPFFSAAETAAIRTVVPVADLPSAYSQNQVRSMAAELSGSPVGGALYAFAHAIPFGADAVTFLLEAAALTAIRNPLPAPQKRTGRRGIWNEIGEGLQFVGRNDFLRSAVIAGGTINFAAMWPALLITLHARNISPTLIGAAMAGMTAAGLIGALLAPVVSRNRPPGHVMIVAVWWLVAAVAGMAAMPATAVLLGALMVALLAVPVVGILLSSYEAAITPDAFIGRVGSANRFVCTLAIPAGQALGGVLIAAGGPHLAFGVYAAAVLAGALIMTASPAVRQLKSVQ
ncbi:MAG TPA: MFS transporter, partial [Mycobacteriales bacterium]|nr:MFS transporter [Mycobacteriales bacterium]